MYKEYIKEIKSEKRDTLFTILKDFMLLYIRLNSFKYMTEKNMLKNLIMEYLKYDYNELVVLNEIEKRFGYKDNNIYIDNLLNGFDAIFDNYYRYLDECFNYYENINQNDNQKPINNNIVFDDNYKNKILEIVRRI